jgi:hypothetical protein
MLKRPGTGPTPSRRFLCLPRAGSSWRAWAPWVLRGGGDRTVLPTLRNAQRIPTTSSRWGPLFVEAEPPRDPRSVKRWGAAITLPGFIGSRKRFQRLPYRPRAFGPADASPAAPPSGGAGCRCAGTAERAPPIADLGGRWTPVIALDGHHFASIPYAGRQLAFLASRPSAHSRHRMPLKKKTGRSPPLALSAAQAGQAIRARSGRACPAPLCQPARPSSAERMGEPMLMKENGRRPGGGGARGSAVGDGGLGGGEVSRHNFRRLVGDRRLERVAAPSPPRRRAVPAAITIPSSPTSMPTTSRS